MRRQRHDRNELIERAKEYLAHETQGRVSVAAIARRIGVSPSHLAHAFRSAEEVPLYRYAVQLRLRRAATVLAKSDDLARLALDLGFASHSHFSTAFLRWAGCTPSAYRWKLRQAADTAIRQSDAHNHDGSPIRPESASLTTRRSSGTVDAGANAMEHPKPGHTVNDPPPEPPVPIDDPDPGPVDEPPPQESSG